VGLVHVTEPLQFAPRSLGYLHPALAKRNIEQGIAEYRSVSRDVAGGCVHSNQDRGLIDVSLIEISAESL
jgi:hypothetical protein